MKKTLTAVAALILPLIVSTSHAEVTQDCIMEGNVDKRKAAQLGQDAYVTFRSAERGEAAPCEMSRRSKSRRIEFKAPETDELSDAPHGASVKYRYTERNNTNGQWQLIERSDLDI